MSLNNPAYRPTTTFLSVLAVVALLWAYTAIPARAGGVLYVTPMGSGLGSSWSDAASLTHALTSAAAGDQLWLAAGTYVPTTPIGREATFMLKSDIALYGGFAGNETQLAQRNTRSNVTLLSGDQGIIGDITDNSYNVLRATDVHSVRLDGLTVAHGNSDGYGGGLLSSRSDVILNDMIFIDNRAGDVGGGVSNQGGDTQVTNVSFIGNISGEAGGGMYQSDGHATLTNVLFSGNSAANWGGGLEVDPPATATVTNATFSGNVAPDGGDAIYGWNTSPNTTITIKNSILWGEHDSVIGGVAMAVDHSIVRGGHAGAGVTSADPQFVDADGVDAIVGTADDNLYLQATSPALDAGDQSALNNIVIDRDGKSRVVGGQVDLGAYERQAPTRLTLTPIADTRVQARYPQQTNGSSTVLIVDGNDDLRESYLRFAIAPVQAGITQAKLRLYVDSNGTKNGPAIYSAGTNWEESTLSWATRPSRSATPLDNSGVIGKQQWVEYDVTAAVQQANSVAFVLVGEVNDSVTFGSRESGTPPQLVLTMNPE